MPPALSKIAEDPDDMLEARQPATTSEASSAQQ